MNKLFKIKAEIKINGKGGRTWPVETGYRPAFNFIDDKQTSGSIKLLTVNCLMPGETGLVEISFISDSFLGKVEVGSKFRFFEGPVEIGRGAVLEVLGWSIK